MGYWQGKNILFIGDSQTARHVYPEIVKEMLGANVFYHCKGGAGFTQMVEGSPADLIGYMPPLTAETVKDMDLIVIYGGYNERNRKLGSAGDRYDPKIKNEKTVAGLMQYLIDSIYDRLEEADNLGCRLMIVTVSCAGKYPWVNTDGYTEYYPDSGLSLENMAKVQKEVGEYNSIPVCDLFKALGSNRRTWSYFGAQKDPINPNYAMYPLNEKGEQVSDTPIVYEQGKEYYQLRDGKIMLEKYEGLARYPYNGDQLHKSPEGYRRIGEVIAGAIIASYGN